MSAASAELGPDVQAVLEALDALYNKPDNEAKQGANRWLQGFQKTVRRPLREKGDRSFSAGGFTARALTWFCLILAMCAAGGVADGKHAAPLADAACRATTVCCADISHQGAYQGGA